MAAVAESIALPLRYHWKAKLVELSQVPTLADSVCPTARDPEIVGTGASVNAKPAADTFVSVAAFVVGLGVADGLGAGV